MQKKTLCNPIIAWVFYSTPELIIRIIIISIYAIPLSNNGMNVLAISISVTIACNIVACIISLVINYSNIELSTDRYCNPTISWMFYSIPELIIRTTIVLIYAIPLNSNDALNVAAVNTMMTIGCVIMAGILYISINHLYEKYQEQTDDPAL